MGKEIDVWGEVEFVFAWVVEGEEQHGRLVEVDKKCMAGVVM